jgi:hypothetical protein
LNEQKPPDIFDLLNSDIFEKVEIFIKRIRELDYVIDKTDNISDYLAISMTEYEAYAASKVEPLTKWMKAYTCLFFINRAIANGIVKPGDALTSKFKECSEENTKLKEEMEIMSNDLIKAKERIEELEQMIPSAGSEHA